MSVKVLVVSLDPETEGLGLADRCIPGAAVEIGPQGPPSTVPGPPGPPGTVGYNHTQGAADTTWTINHNLGYKPVVDVFTTGWLEMLAEVVHTSDNQTVVGFVTAQAGFARLI